MSNRFHRQHANERLGGDGILRVVGTIGAIGGVIAIAAKTVSENYSNRRAEDRPPSSVERQILAGSRYTLEDSNNSETVFTMEDLEILAREYREEVPIASAANKFDRVCWLGEMQQLVHDIIGFRHNLDEAQRIGDFVMVSSLTPQVQKMQQDLAQRRREESLANHETLPNSEEVQADANSGAWDMPNNLSKDEVEGLLRSLDTKMDAADVGTPEGLSSWRKLNAEKKRFEAMSRIFDQLEEAKSCGDNEYFTDLNDTMKTLQGEVVGQEKHAALTPKKLTLFQGIKKHFGFKDPSRKKEGPRDNGHSKKLASKSRKRKSKALNTKPNSIASLVKSRHTKAKCLENSAAESEEEEDAGSFRPKRMHMLCPTLIPWNEEPVLPMTVNDMSDAALAFTAPNGAVPLPSAGGPFFANLNEKTLTDFVKAGRGDLDRSPLNLKRLLPNDCSLNEDQVRHLFRNFSDSRNVKTTHNKEYLCISRREFDIFVFCKRRDEQLGLEACHHLMPYRDMRDVNAIWWKLFRINQTDINLVGRMNEEYTCDLRRKVGLLAQLEGLLGNVSVTTSRGRAVIPPTNFVSEHGSSQGSTDTTFPCNQMTCDAVMDCDTQNSETTLTFHKDKNLTRSDIAKTGIDERSVVAADPTWPKNTVLTEGTTIRDIDNRVYYIAQDGESVAHVAKKLSHKFAEEADGDEGPDAIKIEELIEANTERYEKRTFKANRPLIKGTVLVLPPHSWPMRPRGDDEDDDDKCCDICGSPADEKTMLLCDECDTARHMKCCDPPLSDVPAGYWYCSISCCSKRECVGYEGA